MSVGLGNCHGLRYRTRDYALVSRTVGRLALDETLFCGQCYTSTEKANRAGKWKEVIIQLARLRSPPGKGLVNCTGRKMRIIREIPENRNGLANCTYREREVCLTFVGAEQWP